MVEQPYINSFNGEPWESPNQIPNMVHDFISDYVPEPFKNAMHNEIDNIPPGHWFEPDRLERGNIYGFNVFSWGSTPQGGDFWSACQLLWSNDPNFDESDDEKRIASDLIEQHLGIHHVAPTTMMFDDPRLSY